MNDPNPQTAPLIQAALQLWAAGILLAIQVQWWMVLRVTNPTAAYCAAAAHAGALGRRLRTALGQPWWPSGWPGRRAETR